MYTFIIHKDSTIVSMQASMEIDYNLAVMKRYRFTEDERRLTLIRKTTEGWDIVAQKQRDGKIHFNNFI